MLKGERGEKGDTGLAGKDWTISDLDDDDREIIKEAVGDVVSKDDLSKVMTAFRSDIINRLSKMVTRDVLSTHSGGGEVNFLNLDDVAADLASDKNIFVQYDPVKNRIIFASMDAGTLGSADPDAEDED